MTAKTEKKLSDADKLALVIATMKASGWTLPKGLDDDKDED